MIDLSIYTTEALVDAIIRLTHVIHSRTSEGMRSTDYRAQRDLARAELIRRCTEGALQCVK